MSTSPAPDVRKKLWRTVIALVMAAGVCVVIRLAPIAEALVAAAVVVGGFAVAAEMRAKEAARDSAAPPAPKKRKKATKRKETEDAEKT